MKYLKKILFIFVLFFGTVASNAQGLYVLKSDGTEERFADTSFNNISFVMSTATGEFGYQIEANGQTFFFESASVKKLGLYGYPEPVFSDIPAEAVDLGLPSGLKWASYNIGATKPHEKGDYLSWGEIAPKEFYDWSTYKYSNENTKQQKYVTSSWYAVNGYIDNLTTLEPMDDAARMRWGSAWRMPTNEEFNELRSNTSIVYEEIEGVEGFHFIGVNGNSIFLPLAGIKDMNYTSTSLSEYWCSKLYVPQSSSRDDEANSFQIRYSGYNHSPYADPSYNSRYLGLTVRPVRPSLGLDTRNVRVKAGTITTVKVLEGSGNCKLTVTDPTIVNATYSDYVITIEALKSGKTTVIVNDEGIQNDAVLTISVLGEEHGQAPLAAEAVDLGLTSGTLWCNIDLGSEKEIDYGESFAWGETTTKNKFTSGNYAYNEDEDLGDIPGTEYDAARMQWGGKWQMPTEAQIKELLSECTFSSLSVNGYTILVTGPNNNSIRICLKTRYDSAIYWSGTLDPDDKSNAFVMAIRNTENEIRTESRYRGNRIRPVMNLK